MELDRNLLMAAGGAVVVTVAMVFYALIGRKQSKSDAIDRRLESTDTGQKKAADIRSLAKKKKTPQLVDTLKSFAPSIAAPVSDEEQSRLKDKLISAREALRAGSSVESGCPV